MKKIGFVLAALAGLAAPLPSASAHHSFAMFDMTAEKWIEGTVTEFQGRNYLLLERVVRAPRAVE